jgi:hypothetical protein
MTRAAKLSEGKTPPVLGGGVSVPRFAPNGRDKLFAVAYQPRLAGDRKPLSYSPRVSSCSACSAMARHWSGNLVVNGAQV